MSRRAQRLAGEIRDEVARMIASELKDPRLGFVTVTRVELTADLRYARVYVGVYPNNAFYAESEPKSLRVSIGIGSSFN